MAAWLFSFSNDAKSFAGRFKDFHLGKADWDVRRIILQKVPHRILTFTHNDHEKAGLRSTFLSLFLGVLIL
jgi:hypothetical protein